ncbi:hypothetical protein H6F67_04940 [Microcoleus sp. FACHB-1515]|uniref:hypothetical protein n=1 Tax=Cyanophyceae TaxID=3028117 RepID=UPI001683AF92|nr:hypothetical protein [Microcoleus sp. FACHB-1515]MBD2089199.1 hypothetical protein [Microcoleus sp. FACHB-1515]
MNFLRFRWLQLLMILALAIALSFRATSASAQSTAQLSSQISRLEAQNTLLQSRVSRLEAAIGRVGNNPPLPAVPPPSAPAGTSALASDPMFNRLATLAIELRDRIIVLEDRLGIRRPSP